MSENFHRLSSTGLPPKMRPLAQTLLLWVLMGLLFALFNVAYWPKHRQHRLMHPEAFVERARHHLAEGSPELARTVLLEGVARYNPPVEAPYTLLAEIEADTGDAPGLRYQMRSTFYRHLRLGEGAAVQLLLSQRRDIPLHTLTDSFGLEQSGQSMMRALFPNVASLELSIPETVTLLELTGGALRSDGMIGDTGIVAPASLTVYSGGGMDVRRGAHLIVGKTDYADRQRGLHLALLDPADGTLLKAGVFDLWESAAEAARLLAFLDRAPDGCIGLFAVLDDGAGNMSGAIEEAMMTFGIQRGTFVDRTPRIYGLRASFAAIGVRGARPGAAMQAISPEYFKGYRGHPVLCVVLVPEGEL